MGRESTAQREFTEPEPPAPLDELLEPEEVSAWLQMSTGTLSQWRSRGGGPPFVRVGRHVRYPRSEAEKWLAERTIRHP